MINGESRLRITEKALLLMCRKREVDNDRTKVFYVRKPKMNMKKATLVLWGKQPGRNCKAKVFFEGKPPNRYGESQQLAMEKTTDKNTDDR